MSLQRDKYRQTTETILVCLARTGDRDAFAELLNRRQAWIRNLMRRCCGDAALADDLAQDVFLRAWRGLPGLREPGKFAGWLKRIAINVWLRHAETRDPPASQHADEMTPAPGARQPDIAMDLDNALGELPRDVRLCVVLSYHESMTHSEIAGLTGLPLGTTKSHIRRGTAKLREYLAAYAGNMPAQEAS